MSNKIVYLLGAGAMIDFKAPSTKSLTDDFKSIVNKSGFSVIINILDNTYGADQYNFETIIAYVEYLLDWAIANETKGATVRYTNVIRSIFIPQIKNIKSAIVSSLYMELINDLIGKIRVYDSCDENSKQKLLKDYFSTICNEHNVKIYSLNYDRLIPQIFGSKINDGTIKSEIPDTKKFCYNIIEFIESKFTYFNLHGSIYLKQNSNMCYNVYQSEMPAYIKYCIPQTGGSPNDMKIFSPIIAGYSKSQRILSEPYHFGYSSFCADCSDCEKIIIVGYSFSDPHINTILKKYVVENQKKIVIIDYNNQNDYSTIERHLDIELKYIEAFTRKPYGAESQNVSIYLNGFANYLTNAG